MKTKLHPNKALKTNTTGLQKRAIKNTPPLLVLLHIEWANDNTQFSTLTNRSYTYTVLCKSNANELRRNSWLFGAFRRNFAPRDISSTNRDSSPHFRDTYCLERPDLSSDISQCTVVCCDVSRNNSLLMKVRSELSWEYLSAFEQSSQ